MKIGLASTLDLQLLGFWVVLNMINYGIAAGGSPDPGLLAPPILGPRGTNSVGEVHMLNA